MLKERDEPIGDLLRKVAKNEEELETVRQLLNEEIEFSIAQSYLQLKGDSERVDARCIRGWLGGGEEEAIESVLKYYGEGKLQYHASYAAFPSSNGAGWYSRERTNSSPNSPANAPISPPSPSPTTSSTTAARSGPRNASCTGPSAQRGQPGRPSKSGWGG